MDNPPKKQNYAKVEKNIFVLSVLCCLLIYTPLIIFQSEAQYVVSKIMNAVTFSMDWIFELVGFICLMFALWLIFGRYGKVKLGSSKDKPEFTTFTWIAMFFCAGIGAGALYWACLEPLAYLSTPPFQLTPFSDSAREWALPYTFFHWGLTPWAIFSIPGVAFAYSYYNRRQMHFKASYACSGVLKKHAFGKLGTIIDTLVVVGMIGGFATSLGFVFPMISGLISEYCNIPDTLALKLAIGAFFTAIYSYSCYKGLYSGIAKLSNINIILFILLVIYILLIGPTMWIVSSFFDSIGIMFQNFIRMSFYTDAICRSGFPQNWTVFYWAWWLSWAIYIGLFMARISKGRTLRAFLSNMIFVAGGGTILIFAIIGSYGQHVYFDLGIDLVSIMETQGGPIAIYALFHTIPGAKIIIPFFIILLMIAQATGIDSAAYTLANVSSAEIGYAAEPKRWLRIFWSLFIFFTTIVLIIVGGMDVVKLSSVLTSIPLLALQIIFIISIILWLKQDFPDNPILCYDDIKKN